MDNKAAARMSEARAKERDLVIPDVLNADRRAEAEANDELWLRTYCPNVFYSPFTIHQKRIIADCGEALLYGTRKCKAAPRGDGKSSIVKYLALKYAMARQVRFPLIIAATAAKAKKTLASLKRRLASRENSDLAEDYPLECYVARYVDPWPSRARNTTANGRKPVHVEWGADWFVLPTWEEQEPLGPILYALGITSDDLQGCNVYDQRPDFVMLDDLDSRDSLAAEDGIIASKIEEAIDKTVAGLGGQSRRLGQFMLCTITSHKSAAYKYSDPQQKPAFSGERIPAIITWPDECIVTKDTIQHGPHWQTYIELRQHGQSTSDEQGNIVDPFGRKAHAYYLEHQEEMDAGAVLSNPYNYVRDILPDGSPTHVSALQRCYDYVADNGMVSFLTEHQNDPPAEEEFTESGISPKLVQRQLNGETRGVIPTGCIALTHSCDIGKLKGFHWVVRAWMPDGTGHTIDYGNMSVKDVKYGSDEGLERAIYNAVLRRMDEFRATRYAMAEGTTIAPELTLSTFDARWQTDAVLSAVAKVGIGVKGIIGIGRSAGCVKGTFRDVTQKTTTRRPCGTTGAYEELHVGPYGKQWVVHANTDFWKGFEHERWLTPRDKPGCMFLFGESSPSPDKLSPDERAHEEYAKQVCAEIQVQDGHVQKWIEMGKENNYLDASYHTCVAAAMLGIRILGISPHDIHHQPRKRLSLRAMAERVQGK